MVRKFPTTWPALFLAGAAALSLCSVSIAIAQEQTSPPLSGPASTSAPATQSAGQQPAKTIIASTSFAAGMTAQATPASQPAQAAPASGEPAQGVQASGGTITAAPGQAPLGTPLGGGLSSTGNMEFFEFRAFSNLTRVTGEARDRSFLTPGNNSDFDFNYLQDFTRGTNHYEAVAVGRYTDDPRVDPEHTSLQRAYFRVSNPHYELNFGDYLVSYSRFTYNQNLKGVHIMRRWGRGFRLQANGGTFTDRFGSLFKDNIFGKPYTRVVSGLRAEEKFSDDKMIAFNWSYGNDIVRSVPIDPLTGTQTFVPVHNNVFSIDNRFTFFKHWTLQAEAAYSDTKNDTRTAFICSDVNNPASCARNDNRKDYAIRADNTVRLGSWNIGEFYTRIMPSFYGVNARQISDLQDVMLRVSDQLGEHLSVQANYRRTNDDIRGTNQIPQSVFQLPEARVSFRNLPHLGNTLMDIGYRERHQEQDAFGSSLGASRITRAPFVEVGIPISTSVLTVNFEHRANIDHRDPTQQTAANDVSFSFRSIFNLRRWMVTSLARYGLNREIFDRVLTGNNNRNLQGSLVLEAPRYIVLEASYRDVGATLFQDIPQVDPTTFQPIVGSNGVPLYSVAGPSGFRRPSLHAAVTYKFGNNENHTISFSYDRNQNWFALPGQNFFERVMQVTLLWRIRRQ